MIHQKDPQDAKEKVIVAVVNWRQADRKAVANKRDDNAQRAEYKERRNLRVAADELGGTP